MMFGRVEVIPFGLTDVVAALKLTICSLKRQSHDYGRTRHSNVLTGITV